MNIRRVPKPTMNPILSKLLICVLATGLESSAVGQSIAGSAAHWGDTARAFESPAAPPGLAVRQAAQGVVGVPAYNKMSNRVPPPLPPPSQGFNDLPAIELPPATPATGDVPVPLQTAKEKKRPFLSRDEIGQRRRNCVVTTKQTTLSLPAAGGDAPLRFIGGADCITALSLDVAWADVRIAGMGEVLVTLAPNTSRKPRLTSLTVVTPAQTFVVSLAQDGAVLVPVAAALLPVAVEYAAEASATQEAINALSQSLAVPGCITAIPAPAGGSIP